MDKCYQCGKPTKVISTEKELVNDSWVVSTKSICTDPQCQSRIEKKEKERIKLQKEISIDKENRVQEKNNRKNNRTDLY